MENHQRGIFEYKCRRCGEIYLSNYETLDRVAEMLTNVNFTNEQLDHLEARDNRPRSNKAFPWRHSRVSLFGWHRCADKGFGFSDLIGASVQEGE